MLDDGTIVIIKERGAVIWVCRFDPERVPIDSAWYDFPDLFPETYEETDDE